MSEVAGQFSRSNSTPDSPFSVFERFLLTDKGFNAMRRHLTTEFSVENILFWDETNAFCKFAATDIRAVVDNALRIYEKFVSAESPLQVNLSSEIQDELSRMNKSLREKSVYNSSTAFECLDTFKKAQREILALMQNDSLRRFLCIKDNRLLWEAFASQNKAIGIMGGALELTDRSFKTHKT